MARSETVKPNELCKAVQDIITEYSDEVIADLPDIVKATAKKTVKLLKKEAATIGGNVYKNSFKIKKLPSPTLSGTTYVVYSTRYRLTHLLEHGHVIRNRPGGPSYGLTGAFPHWRPAEEAAIEEMQEKIREAIQ